MTWLLAPISSIFQCILQVRDFRFRFSLTRLFALSPTHLMALIPWFLQITRRLDLKLNLFASFRRLRQYFCIRPFKQACLALFHQRALMLLFEVQGYYFLALQVLVRQLLVDANWSLLWEVCTKGQQFLSSSHWANEKVVTIRTAALSRVALSLRILFITLLPLFNFNCLFVCEWEKLAKLILVTVLNFKVLGRVLIPKFLGIITVLMEHGIWEDICTSSLGIRKGNNITLVVKWYFLQFQL